LPEDPAKAVMKWWDGPMKVGTLLYIIDIEKSKWTSCMTWQSDSAIDLPVASFFSSRQSTVNSCVSVRNTEFVPIPAGYVNPIIISERRRSADHFRDQVLGSGYAKPAEASSWHAQ
jgi:hypothetical protein